MMKKNPNKSKILAGTLVFSLIANVVLVCYGLITNTSMQTEQREHSLLLKVRAEKCKLESGQAQREAQNALEQARKARNLALEQAKRAVKEADKNK